VIRLPLTSVVVANMDTNRDVWARHTSRKARVPYLALIGALDDDTGAEGESRGASGDSDTALAVVALLVGVTILVAALARPAPWGVGATLGLLLCVLSARALAFELAASIRAGGNESRAKGAPGSRLRP
jgi:hypothetical protein